MEQTQIPQPPAFGPQPQQQPQYAGPQPMMSFFEAIKTCFAKAGNFSGRARRSEFWWFILFYFVIDQLLSNLLPICGVPLNISSFSSPVVVLLLFVPLLSVQVRRLHDSGHGAGWAWVYGISMLVTQGGGATLIAKNPKMFEVLSDPMRLAKWGEHFVAQNAALLGIVSVSSVVLLISGIVLLVMSVQDSDHGVNAYGPSPKYPV